MQGIGSALTGGPKLVYVDGQMLGLARRLREGGGKAACWGAEFAKGRQIFGKRPPFLKGFSRLAAEKWQLQSRFEGIWHCCCLLSAGRKTNQA